MVQGSFDTAVRLLRVKVAVRHNHSGRQSRPLSGFMQGFDSGAVNQRFLFFGALQEKNPNFQEIIRCWRSFYGF